MNEEHDEEHDEESPPDKPQEPVALSGAFMAVIIAAFGAAVAFGIPLTETQVGVSITLIGAVVALVTAWQRSRVSPIPRRAK